MKGFWLTIVTAPEALVGDELAVDHVTEVRPDHLGDVAIAAVGEDAALVEVSEPDQPTVITVPATTVSGTLLAR